MRNVRLLLMVVLASCVRDVPALVAGPIRAQLSPTACSPTCYPPEPEPPVACEGPGVSCESKGSFNALALNVITFRFDEASKAQAAGDTAKCQAAAHALVLAGRGLPRARAQRKHAPSGDFITRDNQRWSEDAGLHAIADLVETGVALFAGCGGGKLATTAAEELALYGLTVPDTGLDVQGITAIAIHAPASPCPGAPVPLSAVLTLKGQQVKAKADDVTWSAQGGTLDGDVFTLDDNALTLLTQPPFLEVALSSRPEVHARLELVPSFNCSHLIDLRGARGDHGAEGKEGVSLTGSAMDVAQYVLKNHKHGLGMQGGPGGEGGNGSPAGSVEVFLARVQSPFGPLVLARVVAAKKTTVLAFSADAPITLDASGGEGGAGGDGGAGGAGMRGDDTNRGQGGYGTPGGPGGHGGKGGNGGAGGTVTLYFDKAHPELKALVKVVTAGGAAGAPGAGGHGGLGGLGGFGSTAAMMRSGSAGQADAPDGAAGPAGIHGGHPGSAGPTPAWVAGEPSAWFSHELAAGLKLGP